MMPTVGQIISNHVPKGERLLPSGDTVFTIMGEMLLDVISFKNLFSG